MKYIYSHKIRDGNNINDKIAKNFLVWKKHDV